MSWGDRTVEYEDLFKMMGEWLRQESHGDTQVYLTGYGTVQVSAINNWIRVLSILGSRLMNCANGLATINGRTNPEWEDFVQAGYLMDSGRLHAVMQKPEESSPFAPGKLESPNGNSDE